MPLTPAKKQRRYRERRKNNPEKDAESKRKDRERYHANKRLVRDLTTHDHRAIRNGDLQMLVDDNAFLNRTADQLVARGRDISDATNFYFALKGVSKVRLHLITNENIEQSSYLIPEHIVPLLGTMKVFTEEAEVLKYRNLSCFYQRGFCSCMNPKHYVPLKKLKTAVEQSTPITCDSNLCQKRPKGFYNIVYSSDSDDDAPLISLKEKPSSTCLSKQPGTSKQNVEALIEKENINVNKIKLGIWLKISTLKQDYVYLGKSLSEVEDGEVKIRFFKSILQQNTNKLSLIYLMCF